MALHKPIGPQNKAEPWGLKGLAGKRHGVDRSGQFNVDSGQQSWEQKFALKMSRNTLLTYIIILLRLWQFCAMCFDHIPSSSLSHHCQLPRPSVLSPTPTFHWVCFVFPHYFVRPVLEGDQLTEIHILYENLLYPPSSPWAFGVAWMRSQYLWAPMFTCPCLSRKLTSPKVICRFRVLMTKCFTCTSVDHSILITKPFSCSGW